VGAITSDTIKTTLFQLKIDARGLDEIDREYMNAIVRHYAGGPVGIENLSAILSEPSDTIEDVIEPYLMQQGFIQRTPRGRMLTDAGYKHLGLIPLHRRGGGAGIASRGGLSDEN
jgi:Holliday junction DNA helicase RuvB